MWWRVVVFRQASIQIVRNDFVQMFIWLISLGIVPVFDGIFVECWHWDLSHLSPSIHSLVIITPDFPPWLSDQWSVPASPSPWQPEVSPAVRRPARAPTASAPASPGAPAPFYLPGAATVSAAATAAPPVASTSPATSPARPAATPVWPPPPRSSSGGKPPDCPDRNTRLAASQWMPPRYMRQRGRTDTKHPAVWSGPEPPQWCLIQSWERTLRRRWEPNLWGTDRATESVSTTWSEPPPGPWSAPTKARLAGRRHSAARSPLAQSSQIVVRLITRRSVYIVLSTTNIFRKRGTKSSPSLLQLWEESQAENARLRLEINTVRFDLEVARRQLVRVKEEKLCQVERIFVVQKIAKLEDDLKVKVWIFLIFF